VARYRIRHSHLFLRKGPDRSLSWVEGRIRIGDLVALMICAEQARRVEGHEVAFQLMDETHRNLKADVLFRDTIDTWLTSEGPGYGLSDPDALPILDPGALWTAATLHHGRHGGAVIPRLNLDPAAYGGPALPEGPYAVFHPLFDPPYNPKRGMDPAFVNAFALALQAALGDRVVLITDRPELIQAPIRVVSSESLYDLVYLIGHARVHVGGDTGLTHFAAAARVPHLFALYGPHHGQDAASALAAWIHGELVPPFVAPAAYLGVAPDTRPKVDPAATKLHVQYLEDHALSPTTQAAFAAWIADLLAR